MERDILSQKSKSPAVRGQAAKSLPKGKTPKAQSRAARTESRRQKARSTASTAQGDVIKKRSASRQAKASNTNAFDARRVEQLRQSSIELIGNVKFDMMVRSGSCKDYLAWDGVTDMLQNVFGKKCPLNGLARVVLAAQKEHLRALDQERRDAQTQRSKGRKPEYVMRPGRPAAA
jgi:anti-sigma28 factor (negative regulator of flagellin synthesis)